MPDLTLQPIQRPFSATITPPGSKSLTNRALVLAALADGISELANCLFADDTLVMIESLTRLGFRLEVDRASNSILVHGRAGRIPNASADLFCGNSGTSIRFLTGLCTIDRGRFTLDGIPRMRQRPIGQLVDMLRNLGARINYLLAEGYPPLEVHADTLPGGIVRFSDAQSSQFLSALLQVCPCARINTIIDLEGEQTSWPYVAMTMRLMDEFGITCELYRDPKTAQPRQITMPRGTYHAAQYAVEPDASSASYFLALAAIHPKSKITIAGLGKRSLQGDVGFADVLHRLGADLVFGPDFITIIGPDHLEGIDVDLRDMPDTAQTLAVVSLFADSPTTIRGLHTLRQKETDRLAALSAELSKLGATVEIDRDTLSIDPPEKLSPAAIDTYDDHRMAMSFALAATRASGITIRDIECVNKTYPAFFDDLRKLATSA